MAMSTRLDPEIIHFAVYLQRYNDVVITSWIFKTILFYIIDRMNVINTKSSAHKPKNTTL